MILIYIMCALIIADIAITYYLYRTAENDIIDTNEDLLKVTKCVEELNTSLGRMNRHFDQVVNAKISTMQNDIKFQKKALKSLNDEMNTRLEKLEHKAKDRK